MNWLEVLTEMHTYSTYRQIILVTLASFLIVAIEPIAALGQSEPKEVLEDGKTYQASEGVYGPLLKFRKQGARVVGTASGGTWSACFRGSLDGYIIRVKDAVYQDTDFTTRTISYKSVPDGDRDRLAEFPLTRPRPYPDPSAALPTPPGILEQELWKLGECAKHFGGGSGQVSEQCSSRYYLAFIARKGVPGHAFVQWVKVDAEQKMTSAEAFGLYPRDSSSKLLLGAVLGALRNEYLQDEGISGDAVLRLEVSVEEFNATLRIRDEWSRRLTAGKVAYELLGRNCVDFTNEIAHVLHGFRPSIKPSTYDTSDLSDLIGAPHRYISQLYQLNKAAHVPVSALEASCP
ncbi:MAG TPA: hypothetical protein VN493_30030 [Thermoanaerobaculia bacterium]|nr:hypothetical protein [Thermoanaerobaculia bacterium]